MNLKDKAIKELAEALGCDVFHAKRYIEVMISEVKGDKNSAK